MPRVIYPLRRHWRFSPQFSPAALKKHYPDRALASVTVPHANCLLPWHSFDEQAYQFLSVYRRHIRFPRRHRGRRIFVDFDGVMTAAAVYFNDQKLGEHKGGYTPFTFELTDLIKWSGDNVLAVKVDSRERSDIPPFGGHIDYLTFGGIYRDVKIRVVSPAFIANVFAQAREVLESRRSLEVRCFVENRDAATGLTLTAELCDGSRPLSQAQADVHAGAEYTSVVFNKLPKIALWDLDTPKLYDIHVELKRGAKLLDRYTTRFGFRQAEFTPQGFMLNGRILKLRGLNRHQTFPYVGQAMPARPQRRDADILKHELKCNIVRTSHYPQSPYFLDRCDEIGLLVFEEIPGWQHIGDKNWQAVACKNVEEMIRRDWNHPAIILWGVRINESPDNHDFYTETNRLAHTLDPSRQTGGVRCFFESELLEDVFTINDFNPDKLHRPFHLRYLNTEFCGHMYSTKHGDNVERVIEHTLRHARVHNMLGRSPRYAGGIGWCAFDYNTHLEFGSGDRICYHGVSDIFRLPKPAAGFYRSQCDPREEIVIEPAFFWCLGDQAGGGGLKQAVICSNCQQLKCYLGQTLVDTVQPAREQFPYLDYPPFISDKLRGCWGEKWQDLRIDGYIKGKKVASRMLSAYGADRDLQLILDDKELQGDGVDCTRLAFRVTDEFGNPRPFATAAITIAIQGPGEILGENPFALAGGCGAVWIKTKPAAGIIKLALTHPYLGVRTCQIQVRKAPADKI